MEAEEDEEARKETEEYVQTRLALDEKESGVNLKRIVGKYTIEFNDLRGVCWILGIENRKGEAEEFDQSEGRDEPGGVSHEAWEFLCADYY